MHPDEGDRDQKEQEREGTGPDAGEVVQHAETDRQNEAAKPADHADQTAHGTDVVRVIHRDMLEDRRLAKAHEEAQHEDQNDEGHQPHRGAEDDRAVDPLDPVGRGRIGQQEAAQDRDAEGPVHDAACAMAVGQMPAIGPEQARRDGVEGRQQSRRPHVEIVDTDEIARQPERQCHEGAEHEEVIEGKAPDLDVAQDRELLGHRRAAAAAAPVLGLRGVVLRDGKKSDRRHHETRGPDLRHRLPAHRDHHERREDLGHRRPHIARAEDAQRDALPLGRVGFRHIGDADRERAARKPKAERRQQEGHVAVGHCQEPGRPLRQDHDRGEDQSAAEAVGPHPEDQPRQRSRQDGSADQQPVFGLAQTEFVADRQADDGKDRPDGETGGKRDRARPQCPVLFRCPDRQGYPSRQCKHGTAGKAAEKFGAAP